MYNSYMWKILAQIFLQAIKQYGKQKAKSKTVGTVVRRLSIKLFKHIPIDKNIKTIMQFYKAEDKVGFAQRKLAWTNPITGRMYDLYQKQKRKDWEKIFKQIKQLETEYEKMMIKMYQTAEGINKTDFINFRNIVLNTMNEQERKTMQRLFGDKLRLIFNSGWILFGIYIPYGRNKSSGILGLQLRSHLKSSRNPQKYYNWVRVPKWVWEMLNQDPNGETFWIWYKKNRKNNRYLTNQSIYWKKKKSSKITKKE